MSRDRIGAWIVTAWVLCAAVRPAPSQYAGIAPTVRKAAFSRDGRLGVLVYEGGATLLDFENRRETCLIRERGLAAPAFSAGGNQLAIAGRTHYEDSPIGEIASFSEIRIVDPRTGVIKERFADPRVMNILETAFTPAETLFALGANPGRVVPGRLRGFEQLFLWNVTAGTVTPLLPASKARRLIHCVAAFSSDADALVVLYGTEEAEEIKIYPTSDPSSARSIARASGVTAAVAPIGFESLALSPDARTLAYGAVYVRGLGARPTGEICLYDLVKRRTIRKITNVPASVLSPVFLADGRLATLPSLSIQARLRQRGEWWRFRREIDYLRAVTIWNPSSGEIARRIDLSPEALVSLLVPQRNAVVSLAGGSWSICDLDSAGIQDSIAAAGSECISALAGRPDPALREALQSLSIHRILAVSFLRGSTGALMGVSDSGLAYLWDMSTGNDLQRNRFASSADCIAVSDDGRLLAVAGEEGQSVFMIEEDGRVRKVPWTCCDRRASALAVSGTGETLAAGGRDGLLGVWDLNKRALVRQWQGHPAAVRALAFSRDGTMLASSAEDRTVKLWQPISATVPHAVAGYRWMVNALAFAPGPEALLAGGGEDGKIVFWDVKLRKPVRTLEGHRGAVRALAFSPDGSMLVSGGDDGVLVWNAKTGKQLRMLHRNSQEWLEGRRPAQGRPVGYGSSDITVVSIRFSADGRLVACGGTNDTAIVWDTRTWGRRTYRIIDGRHEPGAM